MSVDPQPSPPYRRLHGAQCLQHTGQPGQHHRDAGHTEAPPDRGIRSACYTTCHYLPPHLQLALCSPLRVVLICEFPPLQSQKRDGFHYPEARHCPENQPRSSTSSSTSLGMSEVGGGGGEGSSRRSAQKVEDTVMRAAAAVTAASSSSSWGDSEHCGLSLSEGGSGGRHRTPSTTVELSCSVKGVFLVCVCVCGTPDRGSGVVWTR